MDADLTAGPKRPDPRPPQPAPAAQGAEQRGGSDIVGDQPGSGAPSEPPAGRGDTPVEAATSAAPDGDSPPHSPPPRKKVQLACPLPTPGYSQQEPVAYQPWPGPEMGPQPFPAQGIPPAPPPYTMYTGQPGTWPLPAHYYGQRLPKDYLVEAVLVTVFCCLLSGVLANIYSYKTRAALERGDMAQAYEASRKTWLLIVFSFFFGVFFFIMWLISMLLSLDWL